MGLLSISCKRATYLVSKKEQGKITLWDGIALRMHLSICSLCRRFEEQTGFIIKNSKHIHTDEKLPEEVKQRIVERMEE